MHHWVSWGEKIREKFDDDISPETLSEKFNSYRVVFGRDFSFDQLIKIEELRAKVIIASAIADFPEYLFDQLGIMQNEAGMPTIAKGLRNLEDVFERLCDRE